MQFQTVQQHIYVHRRISITGTSNNVNLLLHVQTVTRTVSLIIVGQVCIRAKWPIRPALISSFCSMKRLGILLLPPGWDANPSQDYPPAL